MAECPTCGRSDFAKKADMRIHHSKSHDESIAGEPVECDWCGSVDYFKPYEAERRRFCSNECQNEWQREAFIGENHPGYRDAAIEFECANCGQVDTTYDNRDYNNRFCSQDCHNEWRSEHQRGENHHQWAGRVEIACEQCGDTKKVEPHKVETSRFCSRACLAEWQSENQVGEDHPLWKGGSHSYGPNWPRQRRRRRELDNHTCQVCKSHRSELDNPPHVHHIRKIRWFRENYPEPEWYELGNRLENLITLCKSCHDRWEGIPLRPEVST